MDEGNPAARSSAARKPSCRLCFTCRARPTSCTPAADRDRFIAQYRRRGGEVELALYDGEVEGFIVRNAGSPAAAQAKERIIAFVHKHLG